MISIITLVVLLMILLPVLLAVALRRRFRVPWWLFGVGMATFLGAQAVHLPLNNWLTDLGLLTDGATGLQDALLQNALVLGLTAGLTETLARAVGYWVLFRSRRAERWEHGVLVGLGHGGVEAMIVAVLAAATVSSLWALRGTDLATLNLAPEQLAAVSLQMQIFETPGAALAPLVERAIAIVLHVALSLLVWQAFKRRNVLYGVLAFVYHAAFDAAAVYVAQQVEGVWPVEAILLAAALPAGAVIVYNWRQREEDEAPRPGTILTELRLFIVALRKELLQQWRTKRVLVVGAVFVLFGLMSPLIANFTPELLRSIEGAQQFADLVPTPTNADALGQYVKNITQFGFIIAVLLGMGAVAGEREKGTAPLVMSKPLPRWAFILSKFAAQALVYFVAFLLAGLGAYYYTLILFEPLQLAPFLFGNFLLFVWLLVFAAVTLLGSAIARTTGAAAGIALGGAVALLLAGSLPRVGPLAPAGLVGWASQLGLDQAVTPNGGALAAGVALIVVFLLLAVAVFEAQEL